MKPQFCIRICTLIIGIAACSLSFAQTLEWTTVDDEAQISVINGIAIDSANAVIYTVGCIETSPGDPIDLTGLGGSGTVLLDASNPIGFGGTDAFIAQFSFAGVLQFIKLLGTNQDECLMDVCLGMDGNIYAVGGFDKSFTITNSDASTVDVTQINNSVDTDMMTIGFNPNGDAIWAQTEGSYGDDFGMAIDKLSTGLAVIGYYTDNSPWINSTTPNQATATTDIMILHYHYDGSGEWFATCGSELDDWDSSDNLSELRYDISTHGDEIYMIGSWIGNTMEFYDSSNSHQFGFDLISSDPDKDIWMARMNDDGQFIWTETLYVSGSEIGGVGIDADCDFVYISGSATATWSEPLYTPTMGMLDSGDGKEIFLMKLNKDDGLDQWAQLFTSPGGSSNNTVFSVETDGLGNVYIGGKFANELHFDTFTSISPVNNDDGFIAQFSPFGTLLSAEVLGGEDDDAVYAVQSDIAGNIFVGGVSGANFGPSSTVTVNQDNAFVSLYTSAGGLNSSCCLAEAVAGEVSLSNNGVCPGTNITAILSSYSGNIQWQLSFDSGNTWENAPGATSDTWSYTAAEDVKIRAYTWLAACGTDYSDPVTLNVLSFDPSECPANMLVRAGVGCVGLVPNIAATNCGSGYFQDPLAGTTIGYGTHTVDIYDLGGVHQCSVSVEVVDAQEPTITCPGDVSEDANEDCQFQIPDYTVGLTANDNCSLNLSQSPAVGTVVTAGAHDITLTASDDQANFVDCTFTLTVNDVTDPVITCPDTQELISIADCEATLPDYTALATYWDVCGGVNVSQDPVAGTVITDDVTVTLTAVDEAGNDAHCDFIVDFKLGNGPSISCPGNQSVFPLNCQFVLGDYTGSTTGSNDCGALPVTQDPLPGTVINGITTVTMTTEDAEGNSAQCQFLAIPIYPALITSLACPPDQDVAYDADCNAFLPDYTGDATATGFCNPTLSIIQDPPAGTLITTPTVVQLIASDDLGNNETCSFIATPVDTTDPTIACPGLTVAGQNATCEYIIGDYTNSVTVSDNCDSDVTVTQSIAPGTVITTATSVTMTATDDAGNSASCNISVQILMVFPIPIPTITCPGDQTVAVDENCEAKVGDWTGWVTTQNFCDATLNITQDPPATDDLATDVLVTMTATDGLGNQDECTFWVAPKDGIDPTIVCPADQAVSFNDDCEYVLADYTGLAVVDDNCDPDLLVTQSPLAGTILDTDIEVTLTVQDDPGNTANCKFWVKPEDTTDPVYTCPGDQVRTVDADCEYTVEDFTLLFAATDNCGPITITQDPIAGTVITSGQTINFAVSDAAGNGGDCSFELSLSDSTTPVISCPGTLSLEATTDCAATVTDLTAEVDVLAECSSYEIYQSIVIGTVLGIGDHTITFQVQDAWGNEAFCDVTLEVRDTTDPLITQCAASYDANVDASCTYTIPDLTTDVAFTDVCPVTLDQSPAAGTQVGEGPTVITFTLEDSSGNTSSCNATVTVNGMGDPTITAPNIITRVVNGSCEYQVEDLTNLTEVAAGCGDLVVTQSLAPGTTISSSEIITFTVTDDAGNSAQTNMIVLLDDQTAPIIECPAEVWQKDANGSCVYVLGDYTAIINAYDNCLLDSYVQSPAAGTELPLGPHTIVLTATDATGNQTQCDVQIEVNDVTAPIAPCLDMVVSTNVGCQYSMADASGQVLIIENCGDFTMVQDPLEGTLLDIGDHVVNLQITDSSGNETNCSYTLTVNDTGGPQIDSCPDDQGLPLSGACSSLVPDFTTEVAISTCSGIDAGWTLTQIPAEGTEIFGPVTVFISVEDGFGNSDDCSFEVFPLDNTPPTLDCPTAPVDVYVDANCGYLMPDLTGLTTSSDNCFGLVTVTQDATAGIWVPGALTSVEMTATDATGNESFCTISINPIDTISPTITECLPDMVVAAQAPCKYEVLDYTGLITASDNCGDVIITQSVAQGTSLTPGTTQIVMSVEDESGNVSTCAFDLTVEDQTDPVITECADDQFISHGPNCLVEVPDLTGAITATDLCTDDADLLITQSLAPGTFVTDGSILEIFVTDEAGNITSCVVTLYLLDNGSPTIDCPDTQVTGSVNQNCEFVLPDLTAFISATDVCDDDVTITQSPAGGTIVGVMSGQIVFTATDDTGNESFCTIPVEITDDADPQITQCPEALAVEANDNCQFLMPDMTGDLVAIDNCSDVLIQQDPAVGTQLGLGTYVVQFTVEDESGNTVTCESSITVNDFTAPIFDSCPQDLEIVSNSGCTAVLPDFTLTLSATDNCTAPDDITFVQLPAPGTEVSGDLMIGIIATDASGNEGWCQMNISIVDNSAPAISCPDDMLEEAVNGDCVFTLPDYTEGLPLTDDCGDEIEYSQSIDAGSLLGLGDYNIWVYASDPLGNIDSCEVSLTVVDAQPPTLVTTVTDIEIALNEACEALMPNVLDFYQPVDNCDDDIEVIQFPAEGTPLDMGTSGASVQLIDDYDNTFLEAFNIIVYDDVAPAFNCPGDLSLEVNADCALEVPDFTTGLDVVDCSGYAIDQTPSAGEIITVETTITLTVTDEYGNANACDFQLIPVDTTPPVVECPEDLILDLDAQCDLTLPNYTVDLEVSDACEIVNIIQSPEPGTTMTPGVSINVTLTVVDASGNETNCEFEITPVDAIPPMPDCPEDIVVDNDPDLCSAVVNFMLPDAMENCPGMTFAQTAGLAPGSEFPVGETVVSYLVTDASGNEGSCSFTVTVEDIQPPIIECPGDIETCESWVEFDLPTATDNCDGVELVQTDDTGLTTGMDFPVGETVLTYVATDASGNMTICNVTITVLEELEILWSSLPAAICADNEAINMGDLVEGEMEITWTGDIAADGTFDPTALGAGQYTIMASAVEGLCQADSIQNITIVDLPIVDVSGDLEVCGLEADLEGLTDAEDHYWHGPEEAVFMPDNQQHDVTVAVPDYGTYTFTFQGVEQELCSSEASIEVTFYQPVEQPEAGHNQTLYATYDTELLGEYLGPGHTTWGIISGEGVFANENDPETQISQLAFGDNELILIASNGVCPNRSDTLTVTVLGIEIPTGFSPNGDGTNDHFEILGLENYPGSTMIVFNRWGNEVYRNEDYQNDWDGFGPKNNPLPADTYFVVIEIDDTEYSGYAILRR